MGFTNCSNLLLLLFTRHMVIEVDSEANRHAEYSHTPMETTSKWKRRILLFKQRERPPSLLCLLRGPCSIWEASNPHNLSSSRATSLKTGENGGKVGHPMKSSQVSKMNLTKCALQRLSHVSDNGDYEYIHLSALLKQRGQVANVACPHVI